MYDNAMDSIHEYLMKTTTSGLLYTAELIPEQTPQRQLYAMYPSSQWATILTTCADNGGSYPSKTISCVSWEAH